METLQEKLERLSAPNAPTNVERFQAIVSEMADIYRRKNSDYGNSFDESCNEFGLISPIIRMSDKLNRLKSLAKDGSGAQVEDEKIEDTLMDLANYAIMTIMWMNNEN